MTRHQRRFKPFTRPVCPSPVALRWDGRPWAFPRASNPADQEPTTHVGVGPGHEHGPGATRSTSVDPPFRVLACQRAPSLSQYGYRPGRSAHQAIGVCRERCWRNDWVLDLDIRKFFDSVSWELTLKAVSHHTDLRWVLLYVERWLKAPLQRADGSLVERDRGTPQGSAISPLLANMFLHYAFDAWMAREFPAVRFERYCDDIIVHARSERHARYLWAAIARRLAECGLELNQQKTRIVYCKDDDRRGSYEHTSFDFLSYTFRPRLSKSRYGKHFVNFSPAVSNATKTRLRREMRSWRVARRSDKSLTDLALMFNRKLQGWINYYGRFYKSMLYPVFRHLNDTLVRWAMRKYKRLRRHPTRARGFIAEVARRQPDLFAHWRFGVRPDGWTMGAR